MLIFDEFIHAITYQQAHIKYNIHTSFRLGVEIVQAVPKRLKETVGT